MGMSEASPAAWYSVIAAPRLRRQLELTPPAEPQIGAAGRAALLWPLLVAGLEGRMETQYLLCLRDGHWLT